MALSKVHSIGLFGLSGTPIEVEADISSQLPSFVLVGLPDASLSESTSRVRAACGNSGFPLPSQKIVVNLSPAAVPKSGSGFDLAIAVAILVAMQVIPEAATRGKCFFGELGLDGSIRAVPGVLPGTLAARDHGLESVVVPMGNLAEARLVEGVVTTSYSSLGVLVRALQGIEVPDEQAMALSAADSEATQLPLDLSQVLGQDQAVEGLVVAAAGGHHLSMIGAPGSGKTMLAERLASILPQLSVRQAVELAAIESIVSDGQRNIRLNQNPRFQAPHHSASRAALIGGGSGIPRPGAVSLAHHGVLFLDEALEMPGSTLDALREPMESGVVTINRVAGSARFPARFQLVLAANPCPCGKHGTKLGKCRCTVPDRRRYGGRISGPILDRIDIRLAFNPVGPAALAGKGKPLYTSQEAASKVLQARAAAEERLKPFGVALNSHLSGPVMREKLSLPRPITQDLDSLVDKGKTSMRGYDRCLRLAWTIADLDGATSPDREHVLRAITLRGSDVLVEV